MKLVAVINTDEQIEEVLEREFPECEIDEEACEVIIDTILYGYTSENVIAMPDDGITIYCLKTLFQLEE